MDEGGTIRNIVMSGMGTSLAQQAIEKFRPFVEVSASRLLIGEQVFLSKGHSGAVVEDPAREALVISDAVKKGELTGLEQSFVSNFFRAQIEGNYVVQSSLLAD